MRSSRLAAGLFFTAVILAAPAGASAQSWGGSGFTITPLPVGFYAYMEGTPVNDAGQVAGREQIDVQGFKQNVAAFFDGTSVQQLGTLGGASSIAYGVNSAGQVVGESLTTTTAVYHAFLYDSGSMQDLGTLGGDFSGARAINTGGEIAGISYNASAQERAFLYDGAMHDLGTLGGETSVAYGINDAGQVVGNAAISTGANTASHAFLYNGGSMQDLGTLGGTGSFAYAVNSAGAVVGDSRLTGDKSADAFLYSGGVMHDLGTLGGSGSFAHGISDAGVVAGNAADPTDVLHAALWEGGKAYALDGIVGDGWSFNDATISPGGTILAVGSQNGGSQQMVVLKPNSTPSTVTPEPPSLLLLATGLMGLVGVGARARKRSRVC